MSTSVGVSTEASPCLLGLPAELRLNIYKEVFRTLEIWLRYNHHTVFYVSGDGPPDGTALLRTCRLLCEEATPSFHDSIICHYTAIAHTRMMEDPKYDLSDRFNEERDNLGKDFKDDIITYSNHDEWRWWKPVPDHDFSFPLQSNISIYNAKTVTINADIRKATHMFPGRITQEHFLLRRLNYCESVSKLSIKFSAVWSPASAKDKGIDPYIDIFRLVNCKGKDRVEVSMQPRCRCRQTAGELDRFRQYEGKSFARLVEALDATDVSDSRPRCRCDRD